MNDARLTAYFQPTYQPPFAAQIKTPSPTPLGVAAVSFAPTSGSQISYPPQDLWCVLLAQAAPPYRQVIFVGLYEDIYAARWIIHEPQAASSGEDLHAILSRVGCKLDLGEQGSGG